MYLMQLSSIFLSDHEFASKMFARAWSGPGFGTISWLSVSTDFYISPNNFLDNQTKLIGHPSNNSNVTIELFKCSIDYTECMCNYLLIEGQILK